MRFNEAGPAVDVEWTLVSAKAPCIICSGENGCRRGFGNEFACCTQVASEWPLSSGGWVHRVCRHSRVRAIKDARGDDTSRATTVAS